MGCFTAPVKLVTKTRIFARGGRGGRQFLVYATQFESPIDLALILPLPVPPKSMAEDVRFFNLEKSPRFFDDLDADFPLPAPAGKETPEPAPASTFTRVGSFEASFAPTVAAFKDFDPKFRFSDGLLEKLPQYADYGFAVFKLKAGRNSVQPLALDFPRRDPEKLFFPTLQIHDGNIPDTAAFDHSLYVQFPPGKMGFRRGWLESQKTAGAILPAGEMHGITDPEAHVYRRYVIGPYKNVDTFV